MVADLARWLRILGEDCLWAPPSWSDDQVLEVAGEEGRVVVTRDDGLVIAARARGVGCVRVPQGQPEDALFVVYRELGLSPEQGLLSSRCSLCNGLLVELDQMQAREWADPVGQQDGLEQALLRHERFWGCSVCKQVFWRGAHWVQIEKVRGALLSRLGTGD
jgi:uncharacterized protein